MAGTLFSIYPSNEVTSMGWRTAPAMFAMGMHCSGPFTVVVGSSAGNKSQPRQLEA